MRVRSRVRAEGLDDHRCVQQRAVIAESLSVGLSQTRAQLVGSIWPMLLGCLLLPGLTTAADWPTYRGDNARLGASTEPTEAKLVESWKLNAPVPPKLAWASGEGRVIEGKLIGHRVRLDDAFRPVAADGRLFFGSSVDHHLYCVDLESGNVIWKFASGGPIRLAPTTSGDRVLFGSDDGRVYCLEAATGKAVWKRQVAPLDEWLLARGEMISKWPVRTGVLVQDGVAYFGAGIFPHEDIYLYGVDVATGKQVWKADNVSAQDAGRNDLSPQGYLLANADKLVVPSGRSLPAVFDLKSGELLHKRTHSWRSTAGGVVGGFRALLSDGQVYASGPHHYLAMSEDKGDVGFGWFEGRQLVIDGTDAYAITGTEVMRVDRLKYAENSRVRHKLESSIYSLSRSLRGKKGDAAAAIRTKLDAATAELKRVADVGVSWKSKCKDDYALLVTATHVIIGGEGQVSVFDKQSGESVATYPMDGGARGVISVDGRVIVSTDTGGIICLAPRNATEPQVAGHEPTEVSPAVAKAVTTILGSSGISRGFCLVLGVQTGELPLELARQTQLKIYCVDPDPKNVQRARKLLLENGVYGHRVTVHESEFDQIPYSNYFANLVVSETYLGSGQLPANASAVARHLKPVGGKLCLVRAGDVQPATPEAQQEIAKSLGLAEQIRSESANGAIVMERLALPGAGNWSHQYGNPANTAVSADTRINGDLGVLWYGDPGPDQMVNRHEGAVGPLSVNGRLFVQGQWDIRAFDAYNGVHLWTFNNEEAQRTGVFQNQNPGNMAAGLDSVFHFVGGACYQVDAATGQQVAVHQLPPGKDNGKYEWGYVATQGDLLFGTATTRKQLASNLRRRGRVTEDATDTVFAIDLKSGKHLWSYQGDSISHRTIAIGPDKVCFINSSITEEQREALLQEDKTELAKLEGEERKRAEERMKRADVRTAMAVDSRTGKKLWEKSVDVTDCSDIGIGGGKLSMIFSDGKLVLCGANANGHYWKQFVDGEFKRRRLVVLSADDGYKLWSKDANYRNRPIVIGKTILAEPWLFQVEDGEQITRSHPITGDAVPWSIMRTGHHCGMITGAESGMLLFRSGATGFFDLNADEGVRHFAGHRLGCWINAIAANGLVLIPEASAGCVCQFSIASTIVMEPRESRRPWTIYSAVGTKMPVKHLNVSLGAPGDRKDELGQVWFSYPRRKAYRETSLDVKLTLNEQFEKDGGFVSVNDATTPIDAAEHHWVFSSCADGLKKLTLPVVGKGDAPAKYTVRLLFAEIRDGQKEAAQLSIDVNGKRAKENVVVPLPTDDGAEALSVELRGIEISGDLTIELEASQGRTLLNGLEVIREGTE